MNNTTNSRNYYNKLLLELFNDYITVCPDIRIGQILSNCIPNIENLFYMESDLIIKYIIINIKSHPDLFNNKIDLSKYEQI